MTVPTDQAEIDRLRSALLGLRIRNPDHQPIVAGVKVIGGDVGTHQKISLRVEFGAVNRLRLLFLSSYAKLADQVGNLQVLSLQQDWRIGLLP